MDTKTTEEWYRVSKHNLRIDAFGVVKVTPKQVVYLDTWAHGITERRVARASEWDMWFPTLAEAVTHVRERLEGRVAATSKAARLAIAALEEFNAKHPKA